MPFFKNWERLGAGALAILLLALHFAPGSDALASSYFDDEDRVRVSSEAASGAQEGSTEVDEKQHTNAQEPHGNSCDLSILATNFPQSVFRELSTPIVSAADQTAKALLMSIYRPPRALL